MNTKDLSPASQDIRNNVLAALQDAEEMGGCVDDEDYILLMTSLKEEIQNRIAAAS